MFIKYTNICHSKALQNLPKFGIFGLKTNHLATLDWIVGSDTICSILALNQGDPIGRQLGNCLLWAVLEKYNPTTSKFTTTRPALW
jgi:hypothetical protein